MKKVLFFGLGAVAASMATCLHELFKKNSSESIKFIFAVRNPEKSKDALYKSLGLLKDSSFLQVKDFNEIEQELPRIKQQLGSVDLCINAATPGFNISIMQAALELNAHYCDLASDIYNPDDRSFDKFPQEKFNEQFKSSKLFALINTGISPGITNLLIGEKIQQLKESGDYSKIKSINIYLLEQIESEQIVFSWSPQVALEELEHDPQCYEAHELVSTKPFTNSRLYEFPHGGGSVRQYPLFQEELISLKQTYPEVSDIRIYTGGSEVELIKNMYQLNLLSHEAVPDLKEPLKIQDVVKMVLPKMRAPETIDKFMQEDVIRMAQFSAMAEIAVEVDSTDKKSELTEVVGLSYHKYNEILGTPYAGATYISYPTGISAAITLFYSYIKWMQNSFLMSGVLKTEQLPVLLGENLTGKVKRELAQHHIDLISHTHLE